VTKFLGSQSNDVTVTKFLGTSSSRFLETQEQPTLTQFLHSNDTSVTKFLDNVVSKFLHSNDITVTKFLDEEDGIAVTKYLE